MFLSWWAPAIFSLSYATSQNTHRASGSTYAGSTSTAVFPPPGADVTQNATFFPAASKIGYAGPTPTGDQAESIQTASAAVKQDVFPLTEPISLDNDGSDSSFNPVRYWGNLSPWFSVDSADNGLPDASPEVPKGCEITQVHLLHRHGARYPTMGDLPAQFAAKLHAAATSEGFSVSEPLRFLSTWTYKLGAELLTPFGRQQLFDNGVSFRIRYGKLLDGFKEIPVWRTTSQARMVDSAVSFAAGFFGVQDWPNQVHLSITVETSRQNNTLNPHTNCRRQNDTFALGPQATAYWIEIYLNSAVERLAASIQGFDLTSNDVFAMQELCAYETVALGYSEFCGLFTEDEWKGFEYALDLAFWYGSGPANPITTALGIGYVQELVARLTKTPIPIYNSSTNRTLDNNPVTFPLTQPMYIDFTHDTTISTIVAAMNLTSFNKQGPLPVTHIPDDQTYTVSHITPFAANLVGQVLSCPASRHNPEQLPYIRWILNDGVVPLTGIKQCAQYSDKDGTCPLDLFIAGMKEIIAEENWTYDCTGNWTLPGVPNQIVNGKPPRA